MEGSLSTEGSESSLGMIPRAVNEVFMEATELQTRGWKYEFRASFLEIYNETIRDLLSDGKGLKCEVKLTGKDKEEVKVTNLEEVMVSDHDQVLRLLRKASQARQVAATQCNAQSSRSSH